MKKNGCDGGTRVYNLWKLSSKMEILDNVSAIHNGTLSLHLFPCPRYTYYYIYEVTLWQATGNSQVK
jgi:hypothetical protein